LLLMSVPSALHHRLTNAPWRRPRDAEVGCHVSPKRRPARVDDLKPALGKSLPGVAPVLHVIVAPRGRTDAPPPQPDQIRPRRIANRPQSVLVLSHATPGTHLPKTFLHEVVRRAPRPALVGMHSAHRGNVCLSRPAGSYNLGIAFGYCSIGAIRMCKLCLFIAFLLAASAGVLLAIAPHHQASANAVPVGRSVN
jgi:hypothetical protein